MTGRRNTGKKRVSARSKGRGRVIWVLLGVVFAGAIFLAANRYLRERNDAKPSATVANGKDSAASKADSQDLSRGLKALVGRWQRPDGGYVIEFLNFDASGRLNARYYNPRPIRVARAEASKIRDGIAVFVELQDVGYPGATYRLVYDARRDVLEGQYFQPAVGQTFIVAFVRMK